MMSSPRTLSDIELQCVWQPLEERLADGLVRGIRLAEVAVEEMPHIDPVLNRQGTVEPKLPVDASNDRKGGASASDHCAGLIGMT